MASPTIQFKRGLVQNLPGLRAGEPGFATDRSDFYVGFNSTTQGNRFFGSSRYWIREDGTNSLKLNLVDKSGNNGIRLAAPNTLAGITTYTLPATPTDGNFLRTNADGTLSWASVTASATFENATLTGITTIFSVDIQGGSINNTPIGLTTAAAGKFTTIGSNSLNVSGIATVGSVSIGATQVISSTFQLQNILSLDATTISTIESAVANAPNIFTDLLVTGISTFNTEVRTPAVKYTDGTAAITIGATGDVGIATNLTVSGNLYVNGTTTQVNTTSLTVEDSLVELGMVDGNVPGTDLNKDLGLLLNYFSGTAKKAAAYWDDSVSRFAIASEVSEASSIVTAAAYAALEIGSLHINNACTGGVQEVIGCIGSELNLQNIVIDAGTF
jgi:hypothetical protein